METRSCKRQHALIANKITSPKTLPIFVSFRTPSRLQHALTTGEWADTSEERHKHCRKTVLADQKKKKRKRHLCEICCGSLNCVGHMYFSYAVLFHLPVCLMFRSDMLSCASCVALPMRNECVLTLLLSNPSNSMHSFRNRLKTCRVTGFLSCSMNIGPGFLPRTFRNVSEACTGHLFFSSAFSNIIFVSLLRLYLYHDLNVIM